MKQYSGLELLRLSRSQKFGYKVGLFFKGIPLWFKNLGIKIWGFIKGIGL